MSGTAIVPFTDRVRAAVNIVRNKEIDTELAAGLLSSVFPTIHGDPPKRGTAELLEAYSQMPWLRAVTSKVAVAVGSTNWRLFGTKRVNASKYYRNKQVQRAPTWETRREIYKRLKAAGELVEVEDHPLLDLLHKANPYHVGVAAKRLLQVYIDLCGEFFQLLERNALGMPVAYWPIPSSWIKEIPTPSHPFYMLEVPNSRAVSGAHPIPVTEMIWAADLDPSQPYGRGSALSGTLGDELEIGEYAAKHVKATFFNRARPDFLAWVKPDSGGEKVGVAELRRLQQRWLQQHQGFWRTMKPHFINRELKIHEFSQDFREQMPVEIMQYERDTIIQVFGFPPEMFGILESSNRATIDAADFLMAKYATEPRLEFLREVWQERLVPEFDDRLILEYDSPVAQDKEHILNVGKAAPYAFEVDEWRDMAGYEELEDDKGKVHPVPVAIEFMDELTPTEPLPDGGGDDSKMLTKGTNNDPSYRLVHRIADKLEPKLRAAFIRAANSLQSKIGIAELESLIAAGNPEAIVNALPWEALEQRLGPVTETVTNQILASVGEVTATNLGGALGVDIGFTMNNPLTQQWVEAYVPRFLEGIQNVSREAVLEKLHRAFSADEGMAPRELAKAIKRDVGLTDKGIRGVEKFERKLINQGVSPAQVETRVARYAGARIRQRAITIARTETIRAANQGQQLVWENAIKDGHMKVTEVKRRWMVTPDDRLDVEVCEPMEGQLVRVDEPFITGTGAAIEGPPAHSRCRCAVGLEFVRTGREVHISISKLLAELSCPEMELLAVA